MDLKLEKHTITNELILLTTNVFEYVVSTIYKQTKNSNRNKDFLLRDYQLNLRNIKKWKKGEIKQSSYKFKQIGGLKNQLERLYEINGNLFHISELDLSNEENLGMIDNFFRDVCLQVARQLWSQPHIIYEIYDNNHYSEYQPLLKKIISDSILLCTRRKCCENIISRLEQIDIVNNKKQSMPEFNNNDKFNKEELSDIAESDVSVSESDVESGSSSDDSSIVDKNNGKNDSDGSDGSDGSDDGSEDIDNKDESDEDDLNIIDDDTNNTNNTDNTDNTDNTNNVHALEKSLESSSSDESADIDSTLSETSSETSDKEDLITSINNTNDMKDVYIVEPIKTNNDKIITYDEDLISNLNNDSTKNKDCNKKKHKLNKNRAIEKYNYLTNFKLSHRSR